MVVVRLNVAEGKGVKVAVGGNQTMVAVGVSVGNIRVKVGSGGKEVGLGRQAASPKKIRLSIAVQMTHFMSLVYYGKRNLGDFLL